MHLQVNILFVGVASCDVCPYGLIAVFCDYLPEPLPTPAISSPTEKKLILDTRD